MQRLNDLKFFMLLIFIGIFTFSCTPKPKNVDHVAAQPDIGTSKEIGDTFKKVSDNFNAPEFAALLNWQGTYNSADVFRSVKDIHGIADAYKSKEHHQQAQQMFDAFYQDGETHTKQPLIYSNYFKAAIGVAGAPIINTLRKKLLFIMEEEGKIDEAIAEIDTRPIAEKSGTVEKFDVALTILLAFTKTIRDHEEIDPFIKKSVADQTDLYIKNTLQPLRKPMLDVLDTSKDLEFTAQAVIDFANSFNYEIESKDLNQLNRIGEIAPALERIKDRDEQSALTALVKLWFFLGTDAERLKAFKGDKKELYDFFKSKDAAFDCLVKDTSLISWCGKSDIIKTSKVFPSIRSTRSNGLRGALAVKAEIKKAFREQMVSKVDNEIRETLANLPLLIKNQVSEGFEVEKKRIRRGQLDLKYFAESYVNEFEKKSFGNTGSILFESSKVDINGSLISDFSITANAVTFDSNYSAKTHGMQMQAMAKRWQSQREELFTTENIVPHRLEVLSGLNKVLSLGGFKTQGNVIVKGVLQAVSGDDTHSLRNIGETDSLFGMPSEISFSSDAATDPTINVGNQAALIGGLSQMIKAFKDYKVDKKGIARASADSIDDSISNFTAIDLITDLSGGIARSQLFPRKTLFALIVGQTAALLKGLQTPGQTPIAMIFEDTKEYHWLNNGEQDRQATIAGLVDWSEGTRQKTINTKDVADFIIALGEFYKITDDLKHTKSDILTDRDIPSVAADGSTVNVSAIDLIDRNREQLKVLVLGLTNFLIFAHAEDGSLVESYNLDTKQKSQASVDIRTYTRTMLAFKTAKDLLNKEDQSFDETVYANPISRLISHMNNTMLDPKTSFYRNAEGSAQPYEVYETLYTLIKVREVLPEEVRNSLNGLLDKWVGTLKN